MLNDLFGVLKNALVDHIRLATGYQPTATAQSPVVFATADKVETVDFQLGAVTMLLVNLEEDRKALPADPYRRTLADGTRLAVNAPVALNICVLFAARFSNYLDSLRHLDLIVQFFQKNRAIDPTSMPKLAGTNIDKVVCELVTIPLTEMNHVWGRLNTAYQPSLIYRVRVVFYLDPDGVPAAAAAKAPVVVTSSMATPPPDSIVPTTPQPVRWAYYCITDLANATTKLRLVDKATTDPLEFSTYCRNLNTTPDASDVLGSYLVRRHPNQTVVRFVSATPVPPSDEPRRYLELQLDTEVLSRPLANPSAASLSRIDLSAADASPNSCDVLTHVIEYRSQVTQTTTQ